MPTKKTLFKNKPTLKTVTGVQSVKICLSLLCEASVATMQVYYAHLLQLK